MTNMATMCDRCGKEVADLYTYRDGMACLACWSAMPYNLITRERAPYMPLTDEEIDYVERVCTIGNASDFWWRTAAMRFAGELRRLRGAAL